MNTIAPERTRAIFLTSPLEGEVASKGPPRSGGKSRWGVREDKSNPPPGGEAPPTSPSRGEVRIGLLAFALLAVLLLPAVAFASPPDEVLAQAEDAFAEGVALRDDSVKAKPAFARAAAGYDELWNRGFHTPELALNRARAHRLAGDLPRAIAALHEGLSVARFSRPLQIELDDARLRVEYPLEGDLAAQCRPRPARTVSTRMSPADAWFSAGFMWLLACVGVARFAMTRAVGWLVFGAFWVAALVLLGALWVQDARVRARDEALPLLVLTNDVTLRKGNAATYPARIDPVLPKGVEVRELTRRGGWVQVRLSGGAVGWVPEALTIRCGAG